MPPFFRSHIIINGRTEILPYTSNQSGRSNVIPRDTVDRTAHGNNIRTQFDTAVTAFQEEQQQTEFVYLVFKSPPDFFLDLEKLDKNDCRLASYKELQFEDEAGVHLYYEATVYLNRRAISAFLLKIEEYLNRDTPLNYNEDGTVKSGGNPFHRSLIANIEEIRAATLASFWQEPEIPFPDGNEAIWWEIWFDRKPGDDAANPLSAILDLPNDSEIQISRRFLKFPEHWVYLFRGTVRQLAATVLYTDRLSEICKPKETAEFFTYLDREEQNNWVEDLRSRVDHNEESNISVCILDTGLTIANPLLNGIVPERNLESVDPDWSKSDTLGHGTPMAGLALYGDLVEALASNERIRISHHLESVKLIEQNHAHNPELYGAVTQEAISRGVTLNPANKRIVCMAVTSEEFVHKGRPSSWSSAIDQALFWNVAEEEPSTLVLVSSGNLSLDERDRYPLVNEDCSIQDPAQAFNAITVGAYTLKDTINLDLFPGAELLALRGAMSPCNTTSLCWDNDWCRKPDIVMEGGNQALQNNETIFPDSLQLLSTAKGGGGRSWLTNFRDTSAATALASRFAAELYHYYPNLWPETIRALIVHSADWTPAMLGNRSIRGLTTSEQEKLISQVGYGVPNMERAKYSANNSLSLIVERELKPYIKDGAKIKTDTFHLFDLPWPAEVLEELFDTPVRFKITLSYYIEPNPGNKQYEQAASYRSHGLRFKMIDSNERPNVFKARISKLMRTGEYEREGGEHWILGNQIRDKGSVHKDIWEGTAAELATRNKIAVHPVNGWWKTRKSHRRYENTVRYSLIMTIETPSMETDIYTPVMNQISVEV